MSDFSSRRVAGLDLVRCTAILLVVISHYRPLFKRFPGLSGLEFLAVPGVEIFFVLSGFLIGGILLRRAAEVSSWGREFKAVDARDFWVRRWFRTLPNYFLFFVAFLLVDQPWTKNHLSAWVLSLFFLQNLFVDLSDGTFGVAWSLCVEEWLYFLLPLALTVCSRTLRNPARAAFYAAVILIIIPTLLRCTTGGKPWDLGVRHIVIYRLDAIAYGVLLAWIARYRRAFFDRLSGRRWALAGVFALVASGFIFGSMTGAGLQLNESNTGVRWFLMNVVFFSAFNIAIIPIVAWASRRTSMPWGFRGLVYRTSLYSYSMYLSHTLVFYFADPLIYNEVKGIFGNFRGMTFVVLGANLALLYSVSATVFHVWEAPMTGLRERYSSVHPGRRLPRHSEPMTPRA
jgi:peptidoglycan/LPS O-acetylase OafA/YrhL